MSTLVRINYIDKKGFLSNEWWPTEMTAADRVKELDTLGMEFVDMEDVDLPWEGELADMIHWLNRNPNTPAGFYNQDKASIQAVAIALESDPNGLAANAPGAKLDAGKTRPWLCLAGFSRAFEKVAEVTTVGAAKYSDNGWASVDNGEERYMEAFGRHMLALGRGEVFDDGPKGTGAMHKAQMIWNLMASLELELRGQE